MEYEGKYVCFSLKIEPYAIIGYTDDLSTLRSGFKLGLRS